MIIILKTIDETYKCKNWDKSVMVQVRAIFAMIDQYYGKNNGIQKFVLLCDRDTTVDEVIELIDISDDICEWADEIEAYDETYIISLYLLDDDSAIIIVTTSDLFEDLQSVA